MIINLMYFLKVHRESEEYQTDIEDNDNNKGKGIKYSKKL